MFKKSKKPVHLSQAEKDYIKQKLDADKERKKTLKASVTFKNDKSAQEFVETSHFRDDDELNSYSTAFLRVLNSISKKKWKIVKIEKIERTSSLDEDNEEV